MSAAPSGFASTPSASPPFATGPRETPRDTPLTVDALRPCLEGVVPGMMGTCAPDGTPNMAYLSAIEYVDPQHIALSFQFFNKTRANVLVNPRATLIVVNPDTAQIYRLSIVYLRTEEKGPLFESMKAKLAGIASHTGMAGVFVLKGADVYRVDAIEAVPGPALPPPPPRCSLMPALRRVSDALSRCRDLDGFLDETLDALVRELAITHAMVLLIDAPAKRLYTVASRGYKDSGAGSEIALGQGVIGVAAAQGTPIRITHLTNDTAYARTVRSSVAADSGAPMIETEIPLPGLAEARSQVAVPIRALGNTLGVLFVESPVDRRFSYDDEDALVAIAAQLGLAMQNLQSAGDAAEDSGVKEMPVAQGMAAPGNGSPSIATADVATSSSINTADVAASSVSARQETPITIRHYPADGSIFLDDDYLIKGVAGRIFRALVSDYVNDSRTTFTNRALRLDPRVQLPDISDNLEARLILLQRRLIDRNACVRIEKTGRGRFRLDVMRPLKLVDA